MKPLRPDYRSRLRLRPKRGHNEQDIEITTPVGHAFRLILRQSQFNPLDFSVILAYRLPQSNQSFLLCRYNGKSHEHENALEPGPFYDFHIYTATERYQAAGYSEEMYAEPTDRYGDLQGAIRCLLTDCGFEVDGAVAQLEMFDQEP